MIDGWRVVQINELGAIPSSIQRAGGTNLESPGQSQCYTPAVVELAQWFLVSLIGSVETRSSLGHQKPLPARTTGLAQTTFGRAGGLPKR
jgi:hypothetical protein